jgi:protein TonB
MDYAQQQRNPAKHLLGLTLVFILHAVLIYALVNGLARKIVEVIKKPIETKIVEEHKPPPPPEAPPPPPPKMDIPPPPFIPPPEVQIAIAAPANTISQVTNKAPAPAPVVVAKPAPKPVVAPTPAKLDKATCASERPPYPAASRRNEETGIVQLRVTYDATGKVTAVEVAKSSGHNRLDEAAKGWVPSCKLVPGTVDGQAVAGNVMLPFSFSLEN